MKQKNNWLNKYPMIDFKKADCNKIKNSVNEKLSEQKGEVIYMKKKRIKPIVVIAAVIAASAASIFTVNAATDGAIVNTVKEWFGDVTVYINGEEVEVPAKFKKIQENDNYEEIEIEIDDNIDDGKEHDVMYIFTEDDLDSLESDTDTTEATTENYK